MKRTKLALIALLIVMALPVAARAGTGASQECTNGVTYGTGTEIPIINTPITLNVEGGPSGDLFHLIVCYSTTPNGDGGLALFGGSVWFAGENDNLICRQDANTVVGVGCGVSWGGPYDAGVAVRVQSTEVPVGVAIGAVDSLACLRDVRLILPSGPIGPFDIGVCAS